MVTRLKSENPYKQNIYGTIQFMLNPLQHENWGVCCLAGIADRDAVIVISYHWKGRLIELWIPGLKHGQWEVVPILLLPLMHPVAMSKSFNSSLPWFLSADGN